MKWYELLRDVGVFALAAYFIQRIMDNVSNQKLEKYKQELDFTIRSYQLTLDTDLERYKSEMNLHLARQTSLHEKRLTIIDATYKELVHLDSAMRAMTGWQIVIEDGEKEQQERITKAQEAFATFNNNFLLNRLYYSKATADILENIRKEYQLANWDFFELKRLQSFTGGQASRHGYREALNKVQDASKRIQEDIPKTLETLEDEFRKILGVN